MRCVWLKAYERSRDLPLLPRAWREEFNHLRPPVDNQLRGRLVVGQPRHRTRPADPGRLGRVRARCGGPTVSRLRGARPHAGGDHRHGRDAAVRHRRLRRRAGAPGPADAVRRRDQRDRQRRRARARVERRDGGRDDPPRRRADHAGRLPGQEPARAAGRHRRRQHVRRREHLLPDRRRRDRRRRAGGAPRVRPRRPAAGPAGHHPGRGDVPVRPARSTRRRTCSSARSRTRRHRRSPTGRSAR